MCDTNEKCAKYADKLCNRKMCVQQVVPQTVWLVGLRSVSLSSVPCFLLSPIDVVIRRHQDDSISELFRLDSVLLHRSSDFPEVIAALCVLGNFYT